MAKKGIARFTRKEAFCNYKVLLLIVTEGETEENYFTMLKKLKRENIEIVCKRGKHSSVQYLIDTINDVIEARELNKNCEGWIILDNDVLKPEDIDKLKVWIDSNDSKPLKYVGLSSPMFEYWLLLHYEVPRGTITKSNCVSYLKRYIPKYKKPFLNCEVVLEHISDACKNGKKKSISLGSTNNGTNLHHLVSKMYE